MLMPSPKKTNCSECGDLVCCYRDMINGILAIPSDQASNYHLMKAKQGQCPFYIKRVV